MTMAWCMQHGEVPGTPGEPCRSPICEEELEPLDDGEGAGYGLAHTGEIRACPYHGTASISVSGECMDCKEGDPLLELTEKGKAMAASNEQVGGAHYKDLPIQPAYFSTVNDLGFLGGCAVKRICRWNRPGGKGVQDIEKAIHELQLLREFAEGD